MQQLIMNNKIIRGVIDFTEDFSAKDVLYNREIAAGFFLNKMRNISVITRYHTEIFFQLAFKTPDELFLFKKPSDYLTKARFANRTFCPKEEEQLKKLIEEEKLEELAEKTWTIAQDTNLKDNTDKIKLFCILTAAYALAHHSPDEVGFDISPEQAERGYLGEPEPDKNGANELEFTSGNFVISRPVREQPYDIYLKRREAEKLLYSGEKITHIKLIADEHVDGRSNINLTLNIYGEDSDEPIQTEILARGEYRFINIVGEYPVLVHGVPKCGQTDNVLCYAEQYSGSYLTVELNGNCGKINHSHYSNRSEGLGGCGAVEIAFNNGHYIYLADDGIIHEKGKIPDATKRYASIDDYK